MKKTYVFDRLDNVLGNYAEGKALVQVVTFTGLIKTKFVTFTGLTQRLK